MIRRRGRGEGSICQRADGRWMARLDLGWRDGKRQTKAIYGRTRRAVADRLNEIMRASREGTLVMDERQTVGQFLSLWLEQVARPRVRPRTLSTYEAAVERHIEPKIGRFRLNKLTPQHLQTWLTNLEADGVSAHRRRYARAVLRMVLNTAMRWHLIARNSATLVDPPRVISRTITPLNQDQSKALLKAASGTDNEAFCTVALACGLRLGESLGLRWADVDLEKGTLQIQQTVQRFGGDLKLRRKFTARRKELLRELKKASSPEVKQQLTTELADVRKALREARTRVQFVEPKSARSRRTISLPTVATSALNKHRIKQLEARLLAGSRWQDHGLVFTSHHGTPLDPRNITREFRSILAKADLPAIRIHDLRHSCATLLLAQGVNPRVVMETLGHSQVSLTLNTYSHVLPTLQQDAAAKMDAALTS